MSYMPCKNPNCKSFGRPHPNCRCAGGMANGGDVKRFCDSSQAHQAGCEYFAEGGEALPEGFQLEAPAPAEPAPAAAAPESELPPGFKLEEEADPEIPPGFKLEEEPGEESGEPGYSIPHSLEEAGTRLGNNGLFRDPTEKPMDNHRLTDQEIQQTGKDYEHAAQIQTMVTGGGLALPAMKAAEAVTKMAELGKAGSFILKNALAAGMIQGENEVSKWMLGEGDPSHPVGAALTNVMDATMGGGILSTVGVGAASTLKGLVASKVGGKLMGFLAGFASAAQHPEAERGAVNTAIEALHGIGEAPKGSTIGAFKAGQKAFDKGMSSVPNAVSKSIASYVGMKTGNYMEGQLAETLAKPLGNLVEKLVRPAARKVAVPVAIKILSSGNTEGLIDALGYAERVAAGDAAASKAVSSLFDRAIPMAAAQGEAGKGARKLEKWIDDGGANQEVQQEIYQQNAAPQGFAEGGPVTQVPKTGGIPHNPGLALHYPEQNMLLAMARGRISNYLTSLKPPENVPRAAFDAAPDMREKNRTYKRALDIAAKPLSIMDEIKKGTLEPDHVKHFNALHPELNGLLQKKLTESIVKAQLTGKKPSYAVRQSLSMFMGTALSAEMQPQNIQAAQRVFAKGGGEDQQAQKQKAAPKKSSTSSLTKSDDAFLTSNQARQTRMNRPS